MVRGFITKDGEAQYDFEALANFPELLRSMLTATASVGQYFKISKVDESGKVLEVVPVNAPTSGGGSSESGKDGEDGYSPIAYVTQTDDGVVITVTDKDGTTTATVYNGTDGTNGTNAVSPVVSVSTITGGHRITITDKNGETTFDVMDGSDATIDTSKFAKTEDVPTKPEDIGAQPAGNYLTQVPSGYATEEFVTNKIAEAELGGEEVDLSGYAQKSEIPTKVSQLANDSGYLTEHQSLSGYATEQFVKDGYQPKGNYLTEHQSLAGYAKTSDIPTKPEDIGAQPQGNYALKSEIPSVPVQSVNGKTGAVQLSASDVSARPSNWMPSASDVGALPSSTKIPAKTSDLTNDSGFITGYTETDPTVPSWAKQSSKPSYTKSEVGLGNVDNVKQYSASNPPPYPVTSVNGKTGAVTITVPTVPTKVSAFTNDAGYLTEISKTEIVQQVIAALPVYNGEVV